MVRAGPAGTYCVPTRIHKELRESAKFVLAEGLADPGISDPTEPTLSPGQSYRAGGNETRTGGPQRIMNLE
jgi:hypothetical protein